MLLSTILIISIFTCIFRLPIVAIGLPRIWIPILDIIPLIIMALFFGYKMQKKKNRILFFDLCSSKLNMLSLFSLIYFFLFFLVTFLNKNIVDIIKLRELTSTTVFLLFPIFIDFCFSKAQVEKLLHTIFPILIIFAFVLVFGEFLLLRFNIASVSNFHFWLMNKHENYPIRISTFMGQGAVSGITSLAGLLYLLHCVMGDFFKGAKTQYWMLLLIFLALITILLCDSFTLLFALCLVSSLIFNNLSLQNKVKRNFTKKMKLKFFITLIIVFFFVLLLFKTSGLGERFIAYTFRKQIVPVFSIYLPRFSNCSSLSLITGFHHLNNSNGCNPGEFHGLALMFKYGFLSQIGWFAFYFYPFWGACKITMKNYFLERSFYPVLGILITFLHYSGAEIWGNNYIFGMLMAIFIKSVRVPNSLKSLA